MIKAIAFESIEHKNHYVADGIEMAFEGDEDGHVSNLENALLLIRNDYQKPTSEDLESFYEMMSTLGMFNYQEFRNHYKAIDVEISEELLEVIRERNEW